VERVLERSFPELPENGIRESGQAPDIVLDDWSKPSEIEDVSTTDTPPRDPKKVKIVSRRSPARSSKPTSKSKREPAKRRPVRARVVWLAGLVIVLATLSIGFSGQDPLAVLPTLPERPADGISEIQAPTPLVPQPKLAVDSDSPASLDGPESSNAIEADLPTSEPLREGYVVQVGVFRSRTNADASLANLLGPDPNGSVYFRRGLYHVVTDLFATEAEAEAFGRALDEQGFSTYVRSWDRSN
jgi:cell division septation protein DedD